MLSSFSPGAERCIAKGKMVVSPAETRDNETKCGRNRVLSKYLVASSVLCDRFRLVTWVKMVGSVRLYIGKDVRLVDDKSRLIDSRFGSGSLSKYSRAGDGRADDSPSDDVDDAREDWVCVSSAFSNSDADGRELVEEDLEVEGDVAKGIDSRDIVLWMIGVLSIALAVLSKSISEAAEVAEL